MTDNERLVRVATATQAEKRMIDRIFNHQDTDERTHEVDARLLTFTETAQMMKLSRPTVYRLVKAGRLKTMSLNGSSRILHSSVVACLNGEVM